MPIAALLAADWSKSSSRRAVYVATTASPSVRRLASPGGWTLTSLLDAAEPWRQHGAVVVAVDAPLGVPRACWTRARAAFRLPASATFQQPVMAAPASTETVEARRSQGATTEGYPAISEGGATPRAAQHRRSNAVGAAITGCPTWWTACRQAPSR